MWKYLLKRFLLMFPTLFGVAVVTFFLIRVIPGDVVELRLAGDRGSVSDDVLRQERARFGLDQPIWKQFVVWTTGVARLDFGTSMWTGSPIWDEIKLRFALSLQVAVMATLIAVLLALPLGVLAALKQDTWVDYAVRIFSIAGLAVPSFWLGIVFILAFLIIFRWLPPMVYTPFWVNPWQNILQLIWPALAVGYRYSAVATRMTDSEEIAIGDITTGASNDIERATKMAKQMVMRYGMSDKLGPMTYGDNQEAAVFLGREMIHERNYSEAVAQDIDREVRLLIENAMATAKAILTAKMDTLQIVAKELIAKETLEQAAFYELIGQPVPQAQA